MTFFQILILAIVQGAAELLPVSSSAHVIVAEKLMGMNPSSVEMTFFLVMLHTGTMFAVLVYFAKRWVALLRSPSRGKFIRALVIATGFTGVVGLALKVLIEKVILERVLGHSKGEIEELFQHLPLIAANLFLVGCLIVYAGRKSAAVAKVTTELTDRDSATIGLLQAVCLPFRGFSRSGATISAALIRDIARPLAEDFSFALAVILTPAVIVLEAKRLFGATDGTPMGELLEPGLIGMVLSFGAGLLALKWLSRWLEAGKWTYFGYYCWFASAIVTALHFAGF
jgi:undecaprenyl-diphosphatase